MDESISNEARKNFERYKCSTSTNKLFNAHACQADNYHFQNKKKIMKLQARTAGPVLALFPEYNWQRAIFSSHVNTSWYGISIMGYTDILAGPRLLGYMFTLMSKGSFLNINLSTIY